VSLADCLKAGINVTKPMVESLLEKNRDIFTRFLLKQEPYYSLISVISFPKVGPKKYKSNYM